MALDPATKMFLSAMAESGAPPLHELGVEQARSQGGGNAELVGPGPEMARVVEDAAGDVPVRVLVPRDEPRGVLVYCHGGWVLGTIDEFDTLGRNLAEQTGCTVVLVDYRLAPEHPYPAAVDDAWTALRWADEQLATDGRPLLVGGDSAGGNLAAAVTLRARAANGPNIALQVLVYPVTDCDPETESYRDPDNQLFLTSETMAWFWSHYAPDEASRLEPEASPLRAQDLSGLPPAVVVTAEYDVLRDEGEEYARRLGAAGVAVEHRRFDGQTHGFFASVNVLPASAEAIDYVAGAIRERCAQR